MLEAGTQIYMSLPANEILISDYHFGESFKDTFAFVSLGVYQEDSPRRVTLPVACERYLTPRS